jgi:hypothetical protein
MPDLQGQPFDPRQPYAQQPYAQQPQTPQATPPTQPYGQMAPPAQPYGQMAPPAQPYGQMAPPPQTPAWGAPPPSWNSAPPKKRKVWPWVAGGVGAVVALGIGAIAIFALIGNAAVTGLNPHYSAKDVEANDVATAGGTLIIGDGATLAFEVDSAWPDQSQLMNTGDNAFKGVTTTYIGAWSTDDVSKVPDVSLIMVEAGQETVPLTAVTLRAEHKSGIKGFVDSLGSTVTDVTVDDAVSYTTASGLKGLHSTFSGNTQGLTLAGDIYSFGHGKNVFFLQVVSYNGVRDDAAIAQILDTLRIDK